MKAVSAEYKKSMGALIRNRSCAQIVLDNIDTTAPNDGQWESDDSAAHSRSDTLDYNYDYKDTYATLELNRWMLDGSQAVLPEKGEYSYDGFISGIISDINGNTGGTLYRLFSEQHKIVGLTLTFDTRVNEWVTEMTVNFYCGGSLVDSQILDIKSAVVELETRAEHVDIIEIVFNKTLPYRRPRIQHVLYGIKRVFDNNVLSSLSQTTDIDPLSRRLPSETLRFSVYDYEQNYDPDNPNGIYAYVDSKSPISVAFGYELDNGSIEWIKDDNYILDSRPTVKNNVVSFTSTGLIGGLSGTFYKSKLGKKNFYDMANEVLLDAGLTLAGEGKNPWVIDKTLKNMHTTAALPIDTHMNCLQLIAHACRCRFFTDDDNIIHIEPFGVTVQGIYSGKWRDNGAEWFSKVNDLDIGQTTKEPYAALELNQWALDGSRSLITPNEERNFGYVSNVLSDANGNFTSPPAISKTFDISHDLSIVGIQFDSVNGKYPRNIEIEYYRGNTLITSQNVTNIDSSTLLVFNDVKNCDKIIVTTLEALPFTRAKVEKVFYRETDFTLNFETQIKGSQSINKIDELKAVSVEMYSYTKNDNTSILYEGVITDTEFHHEFNSFVDELEIYVSGGNVLSSKKYAKAIDMKLSAGEKNVTIIGKTLSETFVTTTAQVNNSGEVDIEKNPLITNSEMRDALAQHVIRYLTMRNTYDCEYRGNPELEAGDVIGLQTQYTDEMNSLILVDEINFNGSLSGKMKVKGLI